MSTLPKSLEAERLITSQEAADFLSISVPTLRRYMKRKEFPNPIRVSTRRLNWRVKDLIQYIAKQARA